MEINYIIVFIILLAGMGAAVRLRKLTEQAAVTGGLLGALLYAGVGAMGLILMAVFFILGTAATSWRRTLKEKAGIAEKNKGQRRAVQVAANAGVAGALALLAVYNAEAFRFCTLMIACSFSAATADTLSSELGSVYGKKFYNIITFKKDKRGLDGVISWEGTLIGVGGSMIIAAVHALGFGWSIAFAWIVLAGTAGNMADSVLGATVERRGMVKNNAVNFLNTLIGALVGGLLYATV